MKTGFIQKLSNCFPDLLPEIPCGNKKNAPPVPSEGLFVKVREELLERRNINYFSLNENLTDTLPSPRIDFNSCCPTS